ncbi:hypothetical protein BIW11_02754 [Tropilaelaps mercedesae]|uniref:ribonuclease Z n=1 Tax=Tropilaelaps mercedesae TaxID=418985 RepID=A0A1V9XXX3_9ACAR|nr:hypothetical protein BIW11_02754 [Tropilaelaps mercedesae]
MLRLRHIGHIIVRGACNNQRYSSSVLNLLADLPKELNTEAGKINSHAREQTVIYHVNSYLQILGNGCLGGPRSVVVFAYGSRYLFNCGEGTQRLFKEYGLKFVRTRHVFFTSPKWENIGGVLGFVLSALEAKPIKIHLNGHPRILELLEAATVFTKIPLDKIERHDKLEYSDHALKIKYVILNKNSNASQGGPAIKQVGLNDLTIPDDAVISFICTPSAREPSFSLERCVDLGVPAGPLFLKLKAGEDITLDDGRIVKYSEVLELDEHPPSFIILECPSEEYLDSLLAAEEFRFYQYREGALEHEMASLVVHITPKSVFDSTKYRTFREQFPAKTAHLLLCEQNSYDISKEVHRLQYKLNLIHNEVFPVLPRSTGTGVEARTKYDLVPHMGFDPEAPIRISPQKYIKEAESSPGFDSVLSHFKDRLTKIKLDDSREYPRLTFLGTGGATSSKERNVSGILMTTRPNAYILLDCGESTWSQLVRHYGAEMAKDILCNLNCVYISHMHIDHHLGLVTLIKEREKLGIQTNLRVLGPSAILNWLAKINNLFDRIKFDFIDCVSFLQCNESSGFAKVFADLGVDRVSTCYVPHCDLSFGIRIDVDGYSVVYSGDTKPSSNLVALGQGCDLLIHEATIETGLEHFAAKKKHCTTIQAVMVGHQMNAKFTLLTHFSQRYCKLPNMEDRVFEEGRVGFAFDHMEVSPKNLKILPQVYPVLKSLFAEHIYFMNEKSSTASKRQRQWEKSHHISRCHR